MSDTPRTDEMLDGWVSEVNGPSKANFIAFARSLERKLRVAEEALQKLLDTCAGLVEQQAMEDSWYKESLSNARAALAVIRGNAMIHESRDIIPNALEVCMTELRHAYYADPGLVDLPNDHPARLAYELAQQALAMAKHISHVEYHGHSMPAAF